MRTDLNIAVFHICDILHVNVLYSLLEVFTVAGNCTDGEVRLVGGNNRSLGRVEVCINNAWGTVCNARFGTNEARVICRQLTFDDKGIAILLHVRILSM